VTATNVIVNADDFGLSNNISEAIVRGHDRGVITSTTLIANAPATEHAANLAKRRSSLGVGIHLNLSTGRPLIDPGALPGLVTTDGCFLPPDTTSRRLIFDLRLVDPIVREYSRQVERCLDLGIAPTHCDTHHGMHGLPVVFEAFRRTLLRYRIRAARSQVRLVIQARPCATLQSGGIAGRVRRDRSMRGVWKRLCMQRMRASGIRTPDGLLRADLSNIDQLAPVQWFDFLVRHAPPGTFEIVLHPGRVEPGDGASNGFLDVRRRDTALVDRSDRPSEHLSGRTVRFISYADLARCQGDGAGKAAP
jgi:predicted glycoside hydrolase/deacetylase ChbG (UPF0249 family)